MPESITIPMKQYEKLRKAAAGMGAIWISEQEAMELTGWGRGVLKQRRNSKDPNKKIQSRTIGGRIFQYNKQELERLFTYQ